MSWELMTIFCATASFFLLFIAIGTAIYRSGLGRNQLNQAEYKKDHGLMRKTEAGNPTRVYRNLQTSNDVVDQYLLSHEHRNVFLIGHLKATLPTTQMLVIHVFDEAPFYLTTVRVEFFEPIDQTFTVVLPKGTHLVNIEVKDKNDPALTSLPPLYSRYTVYKPVIWIVTVLLFFLLVLIGFIRLSQFVGNQIETYLNGNTILLGIGLILLFCMVNYMFLVGWAKQKRRGAR